MKIKVVSNILKANESIAEENRRLFKENGLFVINLISSPGAGKTSLLEKTIKECNSKISIGVIEGDIATTRDAERIEKTGARVIQINTNGACHLDSNMVRTALQNFPLNGLDILFIENVGNLVCPANFHLGEDIKAVMLSITEGDDKPKKYPVIFREVKVLIINKIDLLPYTDCSIDKIKKESLEINPDLNIFEVSCRSGEGFDEWCNYIVSLSN
ncbi:MAG: hydrogenase accessory protein HypB [Nitrospinae bacterium RIFCSPLOWO2_02_39_17]|nr:MAG: hydrogenase accessory protein HypB [Nitrospinae bacterium RIFCSPLOWO2_02_39_17]OGW08520.1 MAG: hydrogenase accessory protein HypB [Nitrospinae bacterium RIFCSPLOWO2_12_39_15]